MNIKETAGKILLYIYQLHRAVPLSMQYRQIGFVKKKDGSVSVTSDKKWLTNNLLGINPSSTDIFNAFMFLIDKGFVKSKERTTGETKIYVGIQLTVSGIDIIESIERDDEAKQDFNVNFNIKIDKNVNVDSLIEDSLGMLVNEN